MQHLPKKGEKKNPSKAGEKDSHRKRETECPEDDDKPARSYYYDDAYGYEDYEPTDDDEPRDAEETEDF